MNPDETLRDKLRKIEALFAGAATPGEKAAAGAAAERIRQRLGQAAGKEKSIEMKFSIPDLWSRQLFIALCRRYGLRPYRHPRMHRQSIMLKGPKSFMEQVLWPEFHELNAALVAYLSEITDKVIREEVHRETSDAEELDEPSEDRTIKFQLPRPRPTASRNTYAPASIKAWANIRRAPSRAISVRGSAITSG